jgi:hypothetical protein
MTIEAMKQALEALERYEYAEARVALRQAIAESEKQEPVAWMYTSHYKGDERYITKYQFDLSTYKADKVWPLYTTPQPKQEPVAIPEGFSLIAVKGFDELMYWIDRCERKGHLENCPDLIEPYEAFDYRTIDTHQQLKREWAGLTDEEVADIERNSITRRQAIRAIEAKLKAKNFA